MSRGGLALVHGFRTNEHDPPTQIDDGHVVPTFDVAARAERLLDAARPWAARLLGPADLDSNVLLANHDPQLLGFLAEAFEHWCRAGLEPPVVPDSFGPPGELRPPGPGTDVRAQAGYYVRDTCTPILAGTWAAAQEAAAVAATGAAAVLNGWTRVYALTRPPGHHAGRRTVSGFCYLNNAAVAARILKRRGRVAILDVDFHHGNGTQEIFWDDPDVLYTSVHGTPERHFPFFSGWADEHGGPQAHGATLNLPLPDGVGGDDWLGTVERAVVRVQAHEPLCVVVSLGFDVCAEDGVGTFEVERSDLVELGRLLAGTGLPVLLVQEGGYALAHLGDEVDAVLGGLLDGSRPSGVRRSRHG